MYLNAFVMIHALFAVSANNPLGSVVSCKVRTVATVLPSKPAITIIPIPTSQVLPVITTTSIAVATTRPILSVPTTVTDPPIVIQEVTTTKLIVTSSIVQTAVNSQPTSGDLTTVPQQTSAPPAETQAPVQIQFCNQFVGKNGVLESNGTQLKSGVVSCSRTPIGLIPSEENMVSTVITLPDYGAVLDPTINNTVKLITNNLIEGFFDDPALRYYMTPSLLGDDGKVQGHQHVTVEFLANAGSPPDALKFIFFKGINEVALDADKEELSAVIPAGTLKLPGLYRICTMSGSFGHQPVLSPIQDRGPSDDCIRVTVA